MWSINFQRWSHTRKKLKKEYNNELFFLRKYNNQLAVQKIHHCMDWPLLFSLDQKMDKLHQRCLSKFTFLESLLVPWSKRESTWGENEALEISSSSSVFQSMLSDSSLPPLLPSWKKKMKIISIHKSHQQIHIF